MKDSLIGPLGRREGEMKKRGPKRKVEILAEYDFRNGARGKFAKRYAAGSNSSQQSDMEDRDPFSPAEIKELERRVRDSRDPVRYMLVSELGRRFMLYYNVSEDVFALNKPSGGTLFKRRRAAERVKKLLGKGISLVKFTTKGGELKRLSPPRGRWTMSRRTNT